MLLATSELFDMPVMSLQTGAEIAHTSSAIIDLATLHILAYELSGAQLDTHPSFLRIEDIRELSDIGFIVDSSDEIITLDDIVVAKRIYTKHAKLEGMHVVDDHGSKLGKVLQSIMSTQTFRIEQLQVSRPFFQSFTETELLIHRDQIVDVNDDTIIVRAASSDVNHHAKLEKQPFINPFRGATSPQPESAKTDRR